MVKTNTEIGSGIIVTQQPTKALSSGEDITSMEPLLKEVPSTSSTPKEKSIGAYAVYLNKEIVC